jgi:hypothetical protein
VAARLTPMKQGKGKSTSDKSPPTDPAVLKRHLLAQLSKTHVRFAELMEARFEHADTADLERYFGMLSTLVNKLEDEDRALKDVLREMAAEYAAIILSELNR